MRNIDRVTVHYADGKDGEPETEEWGGKGQLRVHDSSVLIDTGRDNAQGKPIERKEPYRLLELSLKLGEE